MKAALFSNHLSLYNRRHEGHVAACAKSLNLREYAIDAVTLAELSQLDAMLARHADTGGDTLIINGGDGTLDLIIARLRRACFAAWQPDIILLRGGTTNMTHRDVGYGRDPAQALISAMRRNGDWKKTMRDVMCLSGDTLPGPQYGFFFGTHALARAIRHARGTLHTHGINGTLGEAWMFATTLGALLRGKAIGHAILDPGLVHYRRNGAWHKAQHVFMIATTLKRLVLGMRAAKPATGQLGCIGIVAPTSGLWRQVPSLWHGVPEQSRGSIVRWCDTALTLRLDSEVTLDGELFSTTAKTPITLSIDSPMTFLT